MEQYLDELEGITIKKIEYKENKYIIYAEEEKRNHENMIIAATRTRKYKDIPYEDSQVTIQLKMTRWKYRNGNTTFTMKVPCMSPFYKMTNRLHAFILLQSGYMTYNSLAKYVGLTHPTIIRICHEFYTNYFHNMLKSKVLYICGWLYKNKMKYLLIDLNTMQLKYAADTIQDLMSAIHFIANKLPEHLVCPVDLNLFEEISKKYPRIKLSIDEDDLIHYTLEILYNEYLRHNRAQKDDAKVPNSHNAQFKKEYFFSLEGKNHKSQSEATQHVLEMDPLFHSYYQMRDEILALVSKNSFLSKNKQIRSNYTTFQDARMFINKTHNWKSFDSAYMHLIGLLETFHRENIDYYPLSQKQNRNKERLLDHLNKLPAGLKNEQIVWSQQFYQQRH